MKILFALFGALGDVINGVPVVRALRGAHPDAEIVWMTRPAYGGIAACRYVDRTILCGEKRLGEGIPEEILAREKFDLVLYPQASVHHDEWVAARVPLMDFMASRCGVALEDRSLEIPVGREAVREADGIFAREGLERGEPVVISCRALSCRNWPLDSYRRLAAELGRKVILIGGAEDERIEGTVDCRGLSVGTGVELIRRSALYVGGDTGPTWMACCTPTPVVVFLDPDRRRWVHVGFRGVTPKENIVEISTSAAYREVLELCGRILRGAGIGPLRARMKARELLCDDLPRLGPVRAAVRAWRGMMYETAAWVPRCALCGSFESAAVYRLGGGKSILRCAKCELVYLHPPPDPRRLESYYTAEYKVGSEGLEEVRALDYGALGGTKYSRAKELGFITPYKKSGNLLDVGCSWGFLMLQARELGFSVKGVELSRTYGGFGKEELGLDIFVGRLEEARFLSGYFDVITAIHVLEHLPDPRGTLREIRRILAPNGVVLIIVPNFGSLSREKLGRRWQWLDPHSHYFYFTKPVLERELRRLGFKTRFFSAEGHYGMEFLESCCSPGEVADVFCALRGSELIAMASPQGL